MFRQLSYSYLLTSKRYNVVCTYYFLSPGFSREDSLSACITKQISPPCRNRECPVCLSFIIQNYFDYDNWKINITRTYFFDSKQYTAVCSLVKHSFQLFLFPLFCCLLHTSLNFCNSLTRKLLYIVIRA